MISSSYNHNPDHIHIPRQRSDWRHVDLEQSETPLKTWGPHIAAAIGIVLLMSLVFPILDLIVGK